MALVGLTEVARLTGKHTTTVLHAARAGRLSSSLNSAGQRVFDTAELDRVYGVKAGNSAHAGDAAASEPQRSSALLRENALLTQRVAEQSEVIRTLSQRLEASEEERREAQHKLTALLTHRQTGSVPAVKPSEFPSGLASRVPWWRWWFR
jgi:hypothetical protein